MDINKERELFEESMLRMTDGSFNTTKNHLTGQYTFGVNQTFWAVWQAAKSQAVPEGFVLINAESLAFHAKSIRMFNDGDSEHQCEEIEGHVCSIEAMIEAQEQK